MRSSLRLLAVPVCISALAGVALLADQAKPPAATMTTAANQFLETLDPDTKQAATFDFDDKHRTEWYFTPQQNKGESLRKGVRLDKLNKAQQDAALNLLKAGLSNQGYEQATTIMTLESVLESIEKGKGNTRDPLWYFVSIFGTPSNSGKWGWRFEGHHLSINFTFDQGAVTSASPVLFGTNPAIVKDGPRKGLQTLPKIEKLAKKLIDSLDDKQKALAEQPEQFAEVKEGQATADVGKPIGISAGQLDDAQEKLLRELVQAYATRLAKPLAAQELQRIDKANFDKVTFGYHIANDKPGKPYTYRIQGPTFVVEFLNVQSDSAGNPANHIHSGWRQLPRDFE